ncbi:orotidine-5'-phosphate decarboxylase [Brevibacillus fulvus]|uniref:Orotidine 5'-phosphate decarboxylase n=1 Tax=Brevibacillus fulvus TaxID=1125967 RepID=A0A938Y0K7_9BACL|nr:orotidine-5'-phosphate decarboxylase [Brevibacillus fulvus]
MAQQDWNRQIIIALDYANITEMEHFLNRLDGRLAYVKVGMELFYAAGLEVIYRLKERGLNVFLDLKVHDIPNTAKGAVRSLAQLGVDMINVHAAGGIQMMQAAREGLEQGTKAGSPRPLLIGVTMLTSTSQSMMNEQLAIPGTVEETVIQYARLVKQAGLDGVVASPLEVPQLKERIGREFVTVTPGIRPAGSDKGDQTRVATPAEAFALGSDYIVIGRAVTAAPDPLAAWEQILQSLHSVTAKGGASQ